MLSALIGKMSFELKTAKVLDSMLEVKFFLFFMYKSEFIRWYFISIFLAKIPKKEQEIGLKEK